MTERKSFSARPELRADEPGVVLARFATFNVIDRDGDVTIPGAFGEQTVRMQPFGHDTRSPSVGKGITFERSDGAYAELEINLSMQAGREAYEALKFDAERGEPLQEWSYVFDILDSRPGEFQGHNVRFLKRLKVHSVDPVFLGAGVGTATVAVKGRSTNGVRDRLACELEYVNAYVRRAELSDLLDELGDAMEFYHGRAVRFPY